MHWTYDYPNENDTVSPPFELTGPVENIKIVFQISNLYNAWIESYALLHRLDTNISYGFTLPWENYFDEEWSFKGNTATYIIENILSGKYELLMSSDSNIKGRIVMDMYRGIPNDQNMVVFILLCCIVPGFFFIMSRRFERKRQENAE